MENESLWDWGLRLEREGDAQAAVSAYAQATDTGEEPPELRAVLRYAEQLEMRGDGAAAEAAFRRATEATESDIAAPAWRGVASVVLRKAKPKRHR